MIETMWATLLCSNNLILKFDPVLCLLQPKEKVGLLVLLNQFICKFSTLVHDILDKVFPAIAGRTLSVIPRDVFPSGPGTNTEV